MLLSATLVLFPWTVELWTSFACLEIIECCCICIQAVVESYMRLWHHRLIWLKTNWSHFAPMDCKMKEGKEKQDQWILCTPLTIGQCERGKNF